MNHAEYLKEIKGFIPEDRIYTDELRRLAWGTDAGFYRLTPKIVIRSDNEAEVSKLLGAAHRLKVPVTFRAAGTSLSGQAISDSVLVVVGKHWEKYSVSEDAESITLEPGIVGTRVNDILKPHGRKFGPDPASIGACMVGGIVMNNASGMSCGTHANSDKELLSARIVFADGTVLDTGDEASREAFRASHPEFIEGIIRLREEVMTDPELVERIRYKYSIKNVTGLNILPFVRFEDPFNIIAHLLVGSEGTLAFLSQVTMKTLALPEHKASAMVYFGSIREAAEAVVAMKKACGLEIISAAELLDKRSLTSVSDPMLAVYGDLDLTALLIETTGSTSSELDTNISRITCALQAHSLLGATPPPNPSRPSCLRDFADAKSRPGRSADADFTSPTHSTSSTLKEARSERSDAGSLRGTPLNPPPGAQGGEMSGRSALAVRFTTDPAEYSKYWAIRSGIFPSVGGMRKEGTTCLIEDVAFHIEDLPDATEDLSALLDKHGYDDSCIYGHALEGNFHFIINQAFDTEAEVRRYESMIRDVAEMVVGKYDGSLKAEHGTGRNMAPFVEYEWGTKAFEVMKRVKRLFDPEGILNPGVIFNDDPRCYLKDFKALPVLPFGEHVNKCIECGFCEVNCVSCGFTLSSRTRIAAQREIARLRDLGNPSPEEAMKLRTLVKEYEYAGEQTCAGDGLCSTSCPMGINVGDMTHMIRQAGMPPGSAGYRLWSFAADHYPFVKANIRGVLRLATLGDTVLGDKAMAGICKGLHAGIKLPLWTPSTPKAYNIPKELVEGRSFAGLRPTQDDKSLSVPKVVYFPSCLNQMMGLPNHQHVVDKPLAEEMVALLHKAGYEVIFPEKMDGLCCGTMWESKGMPDLADKKSAELEKALWEASEHGRWPVLCDQSPCLHRMREKITSMKLYEPAEFIMTFLKDRLDFHPTDEPVAVHITCSMRRMGLADTIVGLARLCSTKVTIPEGVGCCAFAGDKGMTHPELNAYALRKLAGQVKGIPVGYSNSRTCEIGLATNSGIPYVSIAYLVNSHTTAIKP